ncbi:hypothetical protein MTR67_012606 [Solanum verrucosum]|uniref:Target of rapamycin complex subunit LST8 n=1 Tax=Solanum verrucosum TaxID=315347 RepID=A0AAF0TH61_SOLVR|nr:hypothetical protein MTR67_012606 [Solanum verrucosum]
MVAFLGSPRLSEEWREWLASPRYRLWRMALAIHNTGLRWFRNVKMSDVDALMSRCERLSMVSSDRDRLEKHWAETELISGDQNGNIRVWDLRANSCSCELVPEVDTAVRSLTVMWDGSLIVAANNRGTCYVWRLLRGTETMTNFEPLHKLQAHDGYILKCLLSPELCEPNRYLATASSDHTVKIWNVDGFTLEKTLIGHERWVWDCVFSVDGAFLITEHYMAVNLVVMMAHDGGCGCRLGIRLANDGVVHLLIQQQDYGPHLQAKISKYTKGIIKQQYVVLYMTGLNLLAELGSCIVHLTFRQIVQ